MGERGEREGIGGDFVRKLQEKPKKYYTEFSTGAEKKSQESAKRYAKRSRQRPFKLPEALATNDRGED